MLSGVYQQNLKSRFGCDSLVTIDLTVSLSDSVTVNSVFLSAITEDASYQWIDCGTMQPIEGANEQLFFPETPGFYALVQSKNGCTDTTACYFVSALGQPAINDLPEIPMAIVNPVDGSLIVRNIRPHVDLITIFSADGRKLFQKTAEHTEESIQLNAVHNQMILFQITGDHSRQYHYKLFKP